MNDESFRIFTEVLRAALHSKWLHATTGKGGCINLREATEERGRMYFSSKEVNSQIWTASESWKFVWIEPWWKSGVH